MRCLSFKPLERGAMLGFCDLELGNGLILRGCVLLESNGRRWMNPPGRPTLDADRKVMIGADGKIIYSVVVDFATKALRSRWSDEAVKAIETFRNSTTPESTGAVNGGTPRAGA